MKRSMAAEKECAVWIFGFAHTSTHASPRNEIAIQNPCNTSSVEITQQSMHGFSE
jgi:hypothetical protein